MAYCYEYPRPALTTDCFIYCFDKKGVLLLLIQRKKDPYKGKWALPGGFVEMEELLKNAAMRELFEETGLEGIPLEQLKVFDKPGRDPRGRTVSVVFWGFAGDSKLPVQGGSDAIDADWFQIDQLPPLAFDHDEIIAYARKFLKI
jgi:8-oxo-dGTP diphosphatase